MSVNTLYSVGHSNGTADELLELLRLAGVNCLVDVRSVPASSYTPQFNKENLSRFLRANGIYYLHFGEEFGARRSDSVIAGQVNFEKATTTEAFKRGVERIKNGLEKGFTIAFMCSEAKPLACHRFSLVSRYFHDNGYDVKHVLHSKEIVSHASLEQEMIKDYLKRRNSRLQEVDEMFGSYTSEQQRIDAYRLKNEEIGYKPGQAYENEM